MTKQITGFITIMALLLLCACSSNVAESSGQSLSGDTSAAPTWQEQYDLGVRYLSEGNYQEAIIAFTAAIEIDPKQALAYVGRGDAYVGIAFSMESKEQSTANADNYTRAETDYRTALELEKDNVDVYLKLADLYIVIGDIDAAIAVLQQGIEATGNEILSTKLNELTVSSMQWTADFTSDDEVRLDNLLEAFAANDREAVRLILRNEDFQEIFFNYGFHNGNRYCIDYGNTINGTGIYLEACDKDDNILWGISGHYGAWKEGLADGDGMEFIVFLNCDSEYYDEQWTTASCFWMEGFAQGACEVLSTYHGGSYGAYGKYIERVGEMSDGIWSGTAIEVSYSDWNGRKSVPEEESSEICFENGRHIYSNGHTTFEDITTHRNIGDASDTKTISLSYALLYENWRENEE